MILVIGHEKGGVGKSIAATNLAVMRAQQGRDVLLVDADPQKSASEFAKVREEEGHQPEISTVAITGRTLAKELARLRPRYDDIVVDCGGRDTATFRSALVAADVLLSPVLPGQFDIWASEEMVGIIEAALATNPKLRPMMFLNKCDTNIFIKDSHEAADLLGDLKKDLPELQLLPGRLCYRVAFRRAVAEGMAVTEMPSKDPKAVAEIRAIYEEAFHAPKE